MATMESCVCSECGKDFDVPAAEQSQDDCMETDCPHCGKTLLLDKVIYWVSSGLGDT